MQASPSSLSQPAAGRWQGLACPGGASGRALSRGGQALQRWPGGFRPWAHLGKSRGRFSEPRLGWSGVCCAPAPGWGRLPGNSARSHLSLFSLGVFWGSREGFVPRECCDLAGEVSHGCTTAGPAPQLSLLCWRAGHSLIFLRCIKSFQVNWGLLQPCRKVLGVFHAAGD